MDLDEPKIVEEADYPDENSGSVYEVSDDERSHVEDAEVLRTSRAGIERGRSRSVIKSHGKKDRKAHSGSNRDPSATSNREVFEDAVEWASSFKEPKLEDIKSPPRLSRGGKKRKAPKPATETRVKRLKSYYNSDYRELLNSEIQDAASRLTESNRLKESQIGSSIWTATEKAALFTALERLGRDDVRGIAERIGSKSQHQVQEYVNLLWQEVMERKENVYQLLAPTDFPVAVEISDECCAVLERAGDALAAHQELAEEKVEKAKWGDTWIINQDVALQIEKKRKEESGEEEMEEVLPAANLLDLSTWVELSDRIFMNPGSPREEDNWQAIAEPGEVSAVRATAFEDFHSLTYNITKRLVSTALFCSMSRLRARGSNKAKHAEVNADDVEAAVNILGLKANSHDFWTGVAKRCSLQVVDDESDPVLMTYNEVEKALRERHPRTRSRSMSRNRSRIRIQSEHPDPFAGSPGQSHNTDSSEVGDADADSDSQSEYTSPDSDEEFMSSPPPPESSTSDSESVSGGALSHSRSQSQPKPNAPATQQASEAAQDAHTEAHDMYTSQSEEIRFWNLLKQAAPFEFTLAPVQEKAPKGVRDELVERENWRDYVGYVNEWETMDTPVMRGEFVRNRRRVSSIAKRRAKRAEEDVNVGVDVDEQDDQDDSGESQVGDEDGQQGNLATMDELGERNEDIDAGEQEGDEDEHLQVESPRLHSPGHLSPDQEQISNGAMTAQFQCLAAESFIESEAEDEEDEEEEGEGEDEHIKSE